MDFYIASTPSQCAANATSVIIPVIRLLPGKYTALAACLALINQSNTITISALTGPPFILLGEEKQFMVKCLAQGHKCRTQAWLGFGPTF